MVCGLNDQKIQQKLLAVKSLELNTAIDTAIAMEAPVMSVRDLHILNYNCNNGVGGWGVGVILMQFISFQEEARGQVIG